MRIENHPILKFERGRKIWFEFEGKRVKGYESDTIASAMIANGDKVFGHHFITGRAKGLYCAIGNCSSCLVNVDGQPNVRACVTKLKANMVIKRQDDKGRFYEAR